MELLQLIIAETPWQVVEQCSKEKLREVESDGVVSSPSTLSSRTFGLEVQAVWVAGGSRLLFAASLALQL